MAVDHGKKVPPTKPIPETGYAPASGPSRIEIDQLRFVVDSMREGYGLLAPDFTILELNNEAMLYDERRREDVVGQSHWTAYPGTEHSEIGRLYRRAMQERVPVKLEHRYDWPDGRQSWFETRAFPAPDGCIAIFFRDITEQRRAQSLLAGNAETFANLIDSNPFGIYLVDADFRLGRISQGARRVFSTIDHPIGRDFAEVLHMIWPDPFATEAIGIFRRTLATGEPYVSRSTVERRADSDAVEAYDWRTERVALPDGRFGVVCYFYDLSERNAYEEQLKQALADKELLAREIDHRVKNSLTVVGSLLSLQRNTASADETRKALGQAADRVTAVAKVHEHLHKCHTLGVVAFADYLKALCDDLAGLMRRDGVSMQCNAIPVDLPAAPAMSLALIANELVTNAFKHGCAAGATLVSVSLEQDAEDLILTVSDNGAGFPATAIGRRASLGFKLIDALGRKLNARIAFPQPGSAAVFCLRMPNPALAKSTN